MQILLPSDFPKTNKYLSTPCTIHRQFYSLPEYEESFPRGHTISYQMSNGSRVERPPHQVVEPAISPRIIEQMVEPRNQRIIEERRNNNRYRTSAPPEISIIENGHETFRTSIPTGKLRWKKYCEFMNI